MTRADALAALDQFVRPVNEAVAASENVPYTLAGFTRGVVFPWYERSWKHGTAMTTKDRVEHHILTAIGDTPLAACTRSFLQEDFLDNTAKADLSQSTLSHLRRDLRSDLRDGRQRQHPLAQPCRAPTHTKRCSSRATRPNP
jgi:hypothetical protein